MCGRETFDAVSEWYLLPLDGAFLGQCQRHLETQTSGGKYLFTLQGALRFDRILQELFQAEWKQTDKGLGVLIWAGRLLSEASRLETSTIMFRSSWVEQDLDFRVEKELIGSVAENSKERTPKLVGLDSIAADYLRNYSSVPSRKPGNQVERRYSQKQWAEQHW